MKTPLRVTASHRPGLVAWGVKTLDAHAGGTRRRGPARRLHRRVWTDNVFSRPAPPMPEENVVERIRAGEREAVLFVLPGAARP